MKNINLYIICVLCFTIFGCQSEVDKFDIKKFEAPGEYSDALALVQDLSVDHIITNETGGSIALNKSIIQFSPASFAYSDGEVVVGEVKLTFIEAISKRDILKYDLATIDNQGDLLKSEFMLHISAQHEGRALILNAKSETPRIFIIDNDLEECEIYSMDESRQEEGWELTSMDLGSGPISYTHDGVIVDATGYALSIATLDWISVQAKLNTSSFASLCLKLSDSNTSDNTTAYILYDNTTTCQRLNVSSNTVCAMTEVPLEVEGTLVILAHKDLVMGEPHLEVYRQRILISANMPDLELMPADVDEASFIEFIEGL